MVITWHPHGRFHILYMACLRGSIQFHHAFSIVPFNIDATDLKNDRWTFCLFIVVKITLFLQQYYMLDASLFLSLRYFKKIQSPTPPSPVDYNNVADTRLYMQDRKSVV